MKKINKLTKIGLIIFIVGCSPLLLIMMCAKLGILDDPNPNPVIFGIMAFLTFWPSLILIFIGIIKQLLLKIQTLNHRHIFFFQFSYFYTLQVGLFNLIYLLNKTKL